MRKSTESCDLVITRENHDEREIIHDDWFDIDAAHDALKALFKCFLSTKS